jgi:hypothetical protein
VATDPPPRAVCCDCSQPLLALPRHNKLAARLPLSAEDRSCSGHHCKTEFDPRCVKTHTSAKCRKDNSPTRRRTPRVQYDLTLRYAIASKRFHVCSKRWSFYTAKTHSGHLPSRNLALPDCPFDTLRCLFLSLEEDNETALQSRWCIRQVARFEP